MFNIEQIDDRGFIKQSWKDRRRLQSKLNLGRHSLADPNIKSTRHLAIAPPARSVFSRLWDSFKNLGSKIISKFKAENPSLIIREQNHPSIFLEPSPFVPRLRRDEQDDIQMKIPFQSQSVSEKNQDDVNTKKKMRYERSSLIEQRNKTRVAKQTPQPLDIQAIKRKCICSASMIEIPRKRVKNCYKEKESRHQKEADPQAYFESIKKKTEAVRQHQNKLLKFYSRISEDYSQFKKDHQIDSAQKKSTAEKPTSKRIKGFNEINYQISQDNSHYAEPEENEVTRRNTKLDAEKWMKQVQTTIQERKLTRIEKRRQWQEEKKQKEEAIKASKLAVQNSQSAESQYHIEVMKPQEDKGSSEKVNLFFPIQQQLAQQFSENKALISENKQKVSFQGFGGLFNKEKGQNDSKGLFTNLGSKTELNPKSGLFSDGSLLGNISQGTKPPSLFEKQIPSLKQIPKESFSLFSNKVQTSQPEQKQPAVTANGQTQKTISEQPKQQPTILIPIPISKPYEQPSIQLIKPSSGTETSKPKASNPFANPLSNMPDITSQQKSAFSASTNLAINATVGNPEQSSNQALKQNANPFAMASRPVVDQQKNDLFSQKLNNATESVFNNIFGAGTVNQVQTLNTNIPSQPPTQFQPSVFSKPQMFNQGNAFFQPQNSAFSVMNNNPIIPQQNSMFNIPNPAIPSGFNPTPNPNDFFSVQMNNMSGEQSLAWFTKQNPQHPQFQQQNQVFGGYQPINFFRNEAPQNSQSLFGAAGPKHHYTPEKADNTGFSKRANNKKANRAFN